MPQIFDLSHPITDEQPCTFTVVDKRPRVSFEEGDSHGMFFVTSHVENLSLNSCTHIDFPGHLPHLADQTSIRAILTGEYPVERFVGSVAVLDVTDKFEAIATYFESDGTLSIGPRDSEQMLKFLHQLDELMIEREDLEERIRRVGATLDALDGILFATGASSYWRYASFESWQYRYFYSAYLSSDACDALVDGKISFVGIDAVQLENPLVNFRGDELPLIVNPACRNFVEEALKEAANHDNHTILLANDVLIYENLRIPAELRGRVVEFAGVPLNIRLPGVSDNSLVRPYVFA